MRKALLLLFFMTVPALACGCKDAPAVETVQAQSPAPAAASVEFALDVTPSPTPVPTPEPTATPLPTPEPESFTVAWIADTQFISSLYPDTLTRMLAWCAANADSRKIKLVLHTGDIVNDFESRRQWEDAGGDFALLSGKVPFLAVCGNHDVGTSTITYTRFKKNIASLYPDPSILFDGGRGGYSIVESDGRKFLFLGTGWGYNDESIAYLNQVLKSHADCTAVLVLHSYLNENGSRTDGGDIIFENVVKKNANVRMVVCGHRDGAARHEEEIDDNGDGTADRTVHELLYNYQGERANDGGGFLRLLTFVPAAHSVSVETYSPPLDEFITDESACFTVENAF